MAQFETPADFWALVDERGADECWEWQGKRLATGYGFLWYRRTIQAHRLAWILFHGMEPPPKMYVRHTCDNPPCCNPNHLRLGTPRDNTQDMMGKGRHAMQARPEEMKAQLRATLRRQREQGITPVRKKIGPNMRPGDFIVG